MRDERRSRCRASDVSMFLLKRVAVQRGLRLPKWLAALVHLGKMDLQGALPVIAQNWSTFVR